VTAEQRHALLWIRLAKIRGAVSEYIGNLRDNGDELSEEETELEQALNTTATNDCPSDELIDWANDEGDDEKHKTQGPNS
jgi:ubiquinone biosynthesis protein COQ9